MNPRRLVATFVALAAIASGAAAGPPAGSYVPTGQPMSFQIRGATYEVTGYRSATWGMAPDQVLKAIAKDFPRGVIGEAVIDPVNKTTILPVVVNSLPPGQGPATVSYIFGAASGRLMHINVDWPYAGPTPAERQALVEAGKTMTADFLGYQWKLLSVARGVAVDRNAVILFAGTGEHGGAVEVRLQGVAYVLQTPTGALNSPEPTGPALLHLAIARTDGQPDVYTLKQGDF
jgi:hypothetical protein